MSSFVLDFDAIFDDFINANQKKWSHDRSQTLGASEVFDCLRKSFFEKRGAEKGYVPDEAYEEDWGPLTRGNLIENYHVVPAVRSHMPEGVEVLYKGDEQETFVLGRNSATPDGLIKGLPVNCSLTVRGGTQEILIPNIESDCVGFEIKSIDPRATLLEERAKHHNQTQMQLGLFRELTPHKPKYAIVLYVDASFLSKITPFVVEFDPKIYAEGKARAAEVWNAEKPLDLMPEGRFSGACAHCRWRTACGTEIVSAIPKFETTLTPETEAKLAPLVEDLTAKRKQLSDAETAVAMAQERVKEFLSGLNSRKVQMEHWSVNWYGQSGRSSYDTEAMEADGIDLTPYKREGKPFDVLRVTPRLKKTKKD